MKKKTILGYSFYAAYNASQENSYLSIDYDDIQLPDLTSSPEILCQRQELSMEAKFIIGIIINTPKEIFELITSPITHKYSKDKILQFLRQNKG